MRSFTIKGNFSGMLRLLQSSLMNFYQIWVFSQMYQRHSISDNGYIRRRSGKKDISILILGWFLFTSVNHNEIYSFSVTTSVIVSDACQVITLEIHFGKVYCVHKRNHLGEEYILASKPMAGVTRSSKQGCQGLHKKDLCPSTLLRKETIVPNFTKLLQIGFSLLIH